MQEFLTLLVSVPIIFFTVPLGLVCGYWMLVLLGAIDFDGVIDGAVDDLESGEWLNNMMGLLGLSGVPTMVAISFFTFFAWVLAIIGTTVLKTMLPAGNLGSVAISLMAIVGGQVAATLAARPLKGLFVVHTAASNISLIGKICTIKTLSVDGQCGQAEIEDGSNLLVQVRCNDTDTFMLGMKALIIDYHSDNEVFDIVPLDARWADDLANGPSIAEPPPQPGRSIDAMRSHTDKEKQQ